MASTSSDSTNFRTSGLTRRPAGSQANRSEGAGPLRADVEPAPRQRPGMQKLAIGAILILGCVQIFLSPTHFRDPKDPRRSWIPFDPARHDPISVYRESTVEKKEVEIKGVHVFSWIDDCLDLVALAVLTNSTLSASRYPADVFFHFLVPAEEDEKLSYYKLKVVIPNSNIEIISQKAAKEKLGLPNLEGDSMQLLLNQIAPLIVPKSHLSLSKYVYISPNTIIKGQIEELFSTDLGSYTISSAENCVKRLGDFVKIEVLNAIQRTAAKSWISDKPYDKNACIPNFNLILVNPSKIDANLAEAIVWWSNVLDLQITRGDHIRLAMALTLYNKNLKLPSSWKLENDETKVTQYDGPKRECATNKNHDIPIGTDNTWEQYLSPKSIAILTH
ncbi:hypothetical protein LUZ60_010370 [Juncus effusus]|nr:hypothetical protein LUZ60_010370 [Juncus effusus]